MILGAAAEPDAADGGDPVSAFAEGKTNRIKPDNTATATRVFILSVPP
jgi:hypothetical protein